MDVKDMEYVVTVARLKSFSKAAAALYVSQPALSQSIKKLENKLNIELFYRDKIKVEVTEAGVEFVKEAEEILKAITQLENKMKLLQYKTKKILSIGISWSYGRYFMADILKIFKQKEWDYSIKVIEGESRFLEGQIEQGNVDFGIFPAPIYNSNLISYPLLEEKLLLAIHTDNIKALSIAKEQERVQHAVSLSALSEFPFILMKKGFKLRNIVNHICYNQNFSPIVLVESENLNTCLSLVENNYGITILPDIVLNKSNSKQLEFFPIKDNYNSRFLLLVANSSILKYIDLAQLAEEFSNIYFKNQQVKNHL